MEQETSNVIDFLAIKEKKEQHENNLVAIKDAIYLHAKLFVSGAPPEIAEKISYGIEKQGIKYISKLMDGMYALAEKGSVKYKLLYLMYKKYGDEVWPSREEELGAFKKGIIETLDEEHPEPPPYGSHLKLLDNE